MAEAGAFIAAVILSAASGFFGAWWGARTEARHDRVERLRARRTDAAADLVRVWADALFVVARAHSLVAEGVAPAEDLTQPAGDAITEGVKHQTMVELLFGPGSPAVDASARLGHALRLEVGALAAGRANEAGRLHLQDATPQMERLLREASQAIARTGTNDDPLELQRPKRLRRMESVLQARRSPPSRA